MTIIDEKWEWSDAQNLVASGALSSGSNVLGEDTTDLEATQQDGFFATVTTTRMGEQAKPLVLLVTVATEFVGAGNLDVKLTSKAADNTLSSGGTTHATIQIPAVSEAGTQFMLPIPWAAFNRHIGVVYTADGSITAGAVDAHVVEAGQLID